MYWFKLNLDTVFRLVVLLFHQGFCQNTEGHMSTKLVLSNNSSVLILPGCEQVFVQNDALGTDCKPKESAVRIDWTIGFYCFCVSHPTFEKLKTFWHALWSFLILYIIWNGLNAQFPIPFTLSNCFLCSRVFADMSLATPSHMCLKRNFLLTILISLIWYLILRKFSKESFCLCPFNTIFSFKWIDWN